MIMFLTIFGLCLFEVICSIDNAIINAQVLSTMQEKARKWFLLWGMLFAVFMVRGFLPWLIVWATMPELGPIEAFMATFSNDPKIAKTIESSAPILLSGGGMFLLLLFLYWLFVEKKHYAFKFEKMFNKHSVWFYAFASILLSVIVWCALKVNTMMAFAAVVGSTAFFITHGFKENAEAAEAKMMKNKNMTDISKIFYLEILDATFSIDGVLGAFAFTLSVPLILIGNGLGAFVVREITIGNIERIKRYKLLKNGAMYSVFMLGMIMTLDSFGFHIPEWTAPICTIILVGYFFYRSRKEAELENNF